MIVATCRTLNEERNIERFCTYYSEIADVVLIADGGSEDDTVALAEAFPKVVVREFKKTVERNGVIRNPHGLHMNYLWSAAISDFNAEWVIFDDCDSIPNYNMRQDLPAVFANPQFNTVMVRRLYLYKDEGYYHDMSFAGYARWAWRWNVGIYADVTDPWSHHVHTPEEIEGEHIMKPPACLLHYSWPDDEEIARKAAFYKVAKSLPEGKQWHPSNFGGELKSVPEWARL